MSNAIMIAEVTDEGGAGKPIGNEDGAVLIFEDEATAARVLETLRTGKIRNLGNLALFAVNMAVVGRIPG